MALRFLPFCSGFQNGELRQTGLPFWVAMCLILINLLLVTSQLFRVLTKKADLTGVGKAIALFLPIYFLWTIIVTFIFPLIFGFK